MLGSMIGVAVAARDLVLLASSAGLLATLEAVDLFSSPARSTPA